MKLNVVSSFIFVTLLCLTFGEDEQESYDPSQSSYDCSDIKRQGYNISGNYSIRLCTPGSPPIQVYCDLTTDGGGWLVFQRRADGSEDFYRNWANYTTGFGDILNEFWIGLDNLYNILNSCGRKYELRFDLEDFENGKRYAKYAEFNITDESYNYTLTATNYSGNAGNSFGPHSGRQFSTFDVDNDIYPGNCAELFKGAWWYYGCHASNLNGLYLRGIHTKYADGVNWAASRGVYYSLKTTAMKIRPFL